MKRACSFVSTFIAGAILLMAPAAALAFPPNSLYTVPLKWQDDAGKSARLSDMAGDPVILTLAYASCKSACPLTMQRMKTIYSKLQERGVKTQFAIISLDPAHDTPAELSRFRTQYKLDDPAWHLLAGSEEDLRKLSVLLGYSYQRVGQQGEIIHSNKIVLLNRQGEVFSNLEGLVNNVDSLVDAVASLGATQ